MKKWVLLSTGVITAVIAVIFVIWLLNDNPKTEYQTELEIPSIILGDNDIPSFMVGNLPNRVVENFDDVIAVLWELQEVMHFSNPTNEFKLLSQDVSSDMTFYRIRQVYGGIPVFGREFVLVVDGYGRPAILSGSYTPLSEVIMTQNKNIQDIQNILEYEFGELELYSYELVIFPHVERAEKSYLLFMATQTDALMVIVGAYTGNILFVEDILFYSASSHYLQGLYNETHTIRIEEYGDGRFRLVDENSGISIRHTDTAMENMATGAITALRPTWTFSYVGGRIENGVLIPDDEYLFQKAITTMARANQVRDFYNVIRNHFSATTIVNAVNAEIQITLAPNLDGAVISNVTGNIILGSSHGTSWTTVDVIAHEFQHYINRRISNLAGGPLNEAYADIFGTLAYNFNNNWRIGSTSATFYYNGQTMTQANMVQRDLSDPSWRSAPSQLYGEFYRIDSPSAHANATVFGHAAYRMWSGGAFTDRYEMGKVFIGSLLFLSRDASFQDAAMAVMQYAEIHGLSDESLAIIRQAFLYTNIIMPSNKNITGFVLCMETGEPVTNATIRFYRVTEPMSVLGAVDMPIGGITTVNADGSFSRNINLGSNPSGNLRILITAEDYATYARVIPMRSITLHDFTFQMRPALHELSAEDIANDAERVRQMLVYSRENRRLAVVWNTHGAPWVSLNSFGEFLTLELGSVVWIQPSQIPYISDEWVHALPHWPSIRESNRQWYIEGHRLFLGNSFAIEVFREFVY